MLPLAGAAGAVEAGVGPGVLPSAGRGRGDFCALAGTARGARGVATPGRGAGVGIPAGFGEAAGMPAGRGVGRGVGAGAETGFWAAMPGFGVGLRLIFSA